MSNSSDEMNVNKLREGLSNTPEATELDRDRFGQALVNYFQEHAPELLQEPRSTVHTGKIGDDFEPYDMPHIKDM